MICITHLFSALFLLLIFAGQDTEKARTLSPLERLTTKVAVESVKVVDMSRLAGHYTNPSKDLVKRMGGALSGDELYLFPDGTFLYCEWADIQPLTIYDKGTWTFTNGAVELKSDPDVTWDPEADRTYLVVRRRSKKKELLLVGVHSDLPRFEAESQGDPELMLLIVCKGRRGELTREASTRVKTQLLDQSWHPEYFKEKPTAHDRPSR
jgi:hypothetical protein